MAAKSTRDKTRGHNTPGRKPTTPSRTPKPHRWSQEVTEHSNAMTLEDKIFTKSPKELARSVKRSAEKSHRRKTTPFQAAMSMLTFYGNRAGTNLPTERKRALMEAKEELRKLYHRPSKAT
ncbi:DUF3175 domain-containing protein [Corallococcus llansteffanensis]|uniref:DUF3175 domain-containing protein n=1 Tax=Corallococcus llansteffanensis TaxID=2316731 RepID=A0A3A8PBH6_9BACT|nr:DUF3175 domain-containing protein [Corallococcus llansteffanensis]RKH53747.1 DUF3175 domain-containing protein [Corallococcus llansteffanensis]